MDSENEINRRIVFKNIETASNTWIDYYRNYHNCSLGKKDYQGRKHFRKEIVMKNTIKNTITKIIVLALVLANVITINPATADAKNKTYKITINATVNQDGIFKVGKKLAKYVKKGIDFTWDDNCKTCGCWARNKKATKFDLGDADLDTDTTKDILKKIKNKHKGIYYNAYQTKKIVVTFKFKYKKTNNDDDYEDTDNADINKYGKDARGRAFTTEKEAEYYHKIVDYLKDATKDEAACDEWLIDNLIRINGTYRGRKIKYIALGNFQWNDSPYAYEYKKLLILRIYTDTHMYYPEDKTKVNATWERLFNGKFLGVCADGAVACCCLARELGFEAYCVGAWDPDGQGHGWCNVKTHSIRGKTYWAGLSGTSIAFPYTTTTFNDVFTTKRRWGDYEAKCTLTEVADMVKFNQLPYGKDRTLGCYYGFDTIAVPEDAYINGKIDHSKCFVVRFNKEYNDCWCPMDF